MMRFQRRSLAVAAAIVLSWGLVVSCGRVDAGGAADVSMDATISTLDTSTNWLEACAADSDCSDGSTCSCGRCTLSCSIDADCAALALNAVCANAPDSCAESRLCMPGANAGSMGGAGAASACSHPADDYTLEATALCFGRELPECPSGSEAFLDACGCGCSSVPDYPRGCRTLCEPADSCAGIGFEDFPDHPTTLQNFVDDQQNDFPRWGTLIAGHCSNGRLFIHTPGGFTGETRFFTAGGQFLGYTAFSDSGLWCDSVNTMWTYWPEAVRCEQATVTLVLGTSRVAEGDIIPLAWADPP